MTFDLAETAAASLTDSGPASPAAAPVRKRAAMVSQTVSREIGEGDLPAVAALLREGFPDKPLAWFTAALATIARMPAVAGMPRFGYLLEAHGQPVGAVLTLAAPGGDPLPATRLNVACWYVQPRYRPYGTILYHRLLALGATCLNVTPAERTWPVIEAQGFRRFAEGVFVGLPLLGTPALGTRIVPWTPGEAGALSPYEQALLTFHASVGCLTFTCVGRTGVVPFVFRHRPSRHRLRAVQLIYCRDLADLGRHAGAIGRYLARHGFLSVMAGTSGPVAGLPGRYLPGKCPMYYKGPVRPRAGDIAYTELALLAP